MKKSILFTTVLLFTGFTLWAQTATKPSGLGTAASPYLIATLDNLYWVSKNSSSWGSYFKQTADIDASSTSTWNGGAGFSPIGNPTTQFTGTYNGNTHIISGLFIHLANGEAGFFDRTGSGSVIENLGLENVDISGATNVGGLQALGQATIRNCYTTGKISVASGAGGVTEIGGLAGQTGNGNVSNCYSACSINSVSTGSYNAGGLIGVTGGTVINCYATGVLNISTTHSKGGLIAQKGGSGVVTNSFWDIQTTGVSTSQGGTGKTTAEMQTAFTYLDAGWSSSVWNIGDRMNNNYPYLKWQNLSGTSLLASMTPKGSGTSVDPYQIASLNDLFWLSKNLSVWNSSSYFIQTEDIDAAATKNWNSGAGFSPIGISSSNRFFANYDGNGHTITSLYIKRTTTYVGLFGIIYGGTIKNIGLINVNMTGNSASGDAGALAGWGGDTISGCYSTGVINGSFAGGLMGQNVGNIINCYSNCSVTGSSLVGGLVGVNRNPSAYGKISDSYSSGSVIKSTGSAHAGGLTAVGAASYVTHSFWDTQTSGQSSSIGGTGKTTAEMKSAFIFLDAGWSSSVWNIGDGMNNGYPYLKWQNPTGTSLLASLRPFGSGTSSDPYQIATLENLYWVSQNPTSWSSYFIQTADINAAATKNWDSGAGFSPIGNNTTKFAGQYNGKGHSIDSLYINRSSTNYIGLFGYTSSGSAIDSLGMENVNITGSYYVGGLVGYNSSGTVTNSFSTGTVSSTVSNNRSVGGLVGQNFHGTVTNSYSTGSVSGNTYVGGLVGYNYGTVTNSYSTGAVSGSSYVGGLVGYNYHATVTNSFWDTQTSGQANSAGGTGKTTAEMKTLSTFTGATWNFKGETANGTADIWNMNTYDNSGYPFLSWQYPNAPGQTVPKGTGTSADPYQIATLNNLFWLSQNSSVWSSYFIQTDDIDAATTKNWDSGKGFSPIGNNTTKFGGNYNGKGHVIDSLTINRSSTDYVGLFGYATDTIKNLGETHVNITGGKLYVGGLAGFISTMSNCYSTGTVTGSGDYTGGLAGLTSTMSNCYSTGTITGSGFYTGGLVGIINGPSSTLSGSYSKAMVKSNSSGSVSYTGGLLGTNNGGTVSNSYATGSVTGGSSSTSYTGGLSGINNAGTVTNSYAIGSVTGGSGSSSYTGGLLGINNGGTVTNLFWNTDTIAKGMGINYGSGTAYGETTTQMQTESTFTGAGWDFKGETANGTADIWNMNTFDNSGYPFLSWQHPNAPVPAIPQGSGTSASPYLISTLENLFWVSQNPSSWGSYFKQTADINASSTSTWNNGAGFPPIGIYTNRFIGTYDGTGHTIDSLHIYSSALRIGLFGFLNGTVKNIGLTNVNITGFPKSGSYMSDVGGLAGDNNGSISNTYVTGSVSSSVSGAYVGGLVGATLGDSISNAYFIGNVSASANNGTDAAGGLVGKNSTAFTYAIILNSYATGSVSGGSNVNVGGLDGFNLGGVFSSYTNNPIGRGGGTQVTIPEMQLQATYSGWDYTNTWGINSAINSGFPYLRQFKYPAGIDSFSPDSAAAGNMDTIRGLFFTGATAVSFGGTPATSFTVVNDSTILAVVGSGATGGVSVTNALGTDTLAGFVYVVPPSGLTYQTDTISAIYKTTITNDSATVTGIVDSWSISPTLPSGLSFNTRNGVVSGTPTIVSALTNYKVVAHNIAGTDTATITVIVNKKNLTITGATATNKVYDGNTTDTISSASLVGIVGSDNVTLVSPAKGTFAQATVGTGISVTAGLMLAGSDTANYSLVQPTGLSANITKKTLTVTGAVADNKVYDGNKTDTISGVSLVGVVGSDNVTLATPDTGTFAQSSVGNGISVTAGLMLAGSDTSNYSLMQPTGLSANITKKTLTVTGAVADSKIYDGNKTDTISGVSLVGVVGSDNVTLATPDTGTFAQSSVGNGISVTAGLMLAGSDTSNYSLTQPTGLSANITKKTLTVSGAVADNKVYDGNKTDTISGASLLGVVGSDNVTLATPAIGTFAQATVGNGIPVAAGVMLVGSDTANYSLTQPTGLAANITKKTLTVSGAMADNKVYDGNTTDTISSASLVGVVGSDNVTLVSPAFGSFAQATVGNGVSVTSGLMLAGSDTANYSLTQPTGLAANIIKKTLTVTGAIADNKVYDGNATDTISSASLVGVVGSDNVTLVSPAKGTFSQATVGTGIPVAAGLMLSGTDASNYSLVQPSGLASNITMAPLTITANNQSKVYDSNVFNGFTVSYNGFVNGETQSVLGGSLAFSGSAVTATDAGNYVITPGGLTSGNYKITFVNGSLKIQKADQTISFGSLPQKHEGEPSFGVSASSTSGLPVSFSSSDNAIASVADTTVTIVAGGTCRIFANQSGDNNYNPAPEVARQLVIIGLGYSKNYNYLFSPNGDGINDYWKIPNLSEMGRVQVKVYDRWGSVVYQSSNYHNNWNGTYRGNPLPVGTYICVIKSSRQGAITGVINLIR